MASEIGILKPEWAEELSLTDVRTITDRTAVLRILIGLAWEEKYIPLIGDVVDHPGELEFQGIYMTHDGESLSVIITDALPRWEMVIHEIKSTYKSTRTVEDVAAQHMWMWQIKAYCKAKETRFAELHVLFICGDYSYPIKPMLRRWRLEFTQDEIDSNWQTLMDYLEYRKAQEMGME